MPTLFAAAGGTAFRFDLPTLATPTPGGERCEVEVTFVADSHAQLLATDGPLCQSQLGPHELFDDLSITRLVVGNTLWLLSGLQITSKAEPIKLVVKAERWQLGPEAAAVSNTQLRLSSAYQEGSCSQTAAQQQRRWAWNDPAAFAPRSWCPPLQGYGPLTTRTSDDPDVVADFSSYSAHRSGWFTEDYDDLTIEQELPVNVALSQPINFMRYVDYLPTSDSFPAHAKLIDRRLAPNSLWSVRQDMQMYFKATRLDPGLRMRTWQLLTTPGTGLPCGVNARQEVFFSLAGMRGSAEPDDVSSSIKQGKAVLKLIPVGADYACQPTSAWPEASYLFNNWRVIVEQDGQQHDLFQPLARDLEAADDLCSDGTIFEQLAEIASAERGAGRIVYAKMPYPAGEQLSGVGVRLRDGGSRLRLRLSKEFYMPGHGYLHSKFGRFDGLVPTAGRSPNYYVEVKPNIFVPEGEYDIIFRVNESTIGDYNRLEYALRPRKSFKPIKREEWLPADTSVLDEWVICFFINLAKVTWGCFNRDLMRPSTASATVSLAPASDSLLSSPSSASTSSLDSSSRESKKPRIL